VGLGGKLRWGDLTPELVAERLKHGTPLLTGTNGTYLYQCMRETETGPDDVRGEPFGHFIVIRGYDSADETVSVADPLLDNPAHGTKYYRASVYRLLAAVFLGVGSDDGNFMLIRPKGWDERGKAKKKTTP
jgi:Peptidase_C39 like family